MSFWLKVRFPIAESGLICSIFSLETGKFIEGLEASLSTRGPGGLAADPEADPEADPGVTVEAPGVALERFKTDGSLKLRNQSPAPLTAPSKGLERPSGGIPGREVGLGEPREGSWGIIKG